LWEVLLKKLLGVELIQAMHMPSSAAAKLSLGDGGMRRLQEAFRVDICKQTSREVSTGVDDLAEARL